MYYDRQDIPLFLLAKRGFHINCLEKLPRALPELLLRPKADWLFNVHEVHMGHIITNLF